MTKLKLFTAVALLFTGSAANASIISYSSNFSTYTQATGALVNGYNADVDIINLQGFNSTLGTLTDVDISFTSSWDYTAIANSSDSTGTITTAAGSGSTGWFRISWPNLYSNDSSADYGFNSFLSVNLVSPNYISEYLQNYLRGTCSQTLIDSTIEMSTCSDTKSTSGIFDSSLDLSTMTLNEFITDNLEFNIWNQKDYGLITCGSGDTCTADTYGKWDGILTVSYIYDTTTGSSITTVPVPGSLALFGFGLLGLFTTRRITKG